jgi:predicted DNA-binding protein
MHKCEENYVATKTKTIRLSIELYNRLEKFCALTGKSLQSVADRALDNYFNDEAPVWEQAAQKATKKSTERLSVS